jgi:hypothetical protein
MSLKQIMYYDSSYSIDGPGMAVKRRLLRFVDSVYAWVMAVKRGRNYIACSMNF